MFNAALRALGFRASPHPTTSDKPGDRSAVPTKNNAGPGVANDWIEDLRRQVSRLEGQVDELQSDIHDQRETHAEEMRRKDIMVQGAMQQIAHLTEIAGLPSPSEPKQIESAAASGRSTGGTLEAEVEPPAQRPVATPAQSRAAAQSGPAQSQGRAGRRKSSENLSVPGWATIEVYEAARLPA